MVIKREAYELTGVYAAWAYSNLCKIVNFERMRMIALPGFCKPEFDYTTGRARADENVKVRFFQRRNKARVILKYEEGAVSLGVLDSLRSYLQEKKEDRESYWKGVKQSIEGVVGGICVADPSIFSDNQLIIPN